MNLLEQTKKLCKLYNIIPARSRGQNFLINEFVYEKIIEAAELKVDDTVLEVGPGLGFLTFELAKRVKQVVAVELDDKLAEALKTGLLAKAVKNVEVVNMDIMKFEIRNLKLGNKITNFQFSISNFKVVANLPYNITSIFLRKFLSGDKKPELMVLMLQKEVAERIVAKPPKMSLLAMSVQFYAEAEIIDYVTAKNFWPEPEVDSAIVKLRIAHRVSHIALSQSAIENRQSKIDLSVDKERDFFRMVKFGFSAKRKMLKNNLAAGYKITNEQAQNLLTSAGINEKIRAEGLSVEDWVRLFGEIDKFML